MAVASIGGTVTVGDALGFDGAENAPGVVDEVGEVGEVGEVDEVGAIVDVGGAVAEGGRLDGGIVGGADVGMLLGVRSAGEAGEESTAISMAARAQRTKR